MCMYILHRFLKLFVEHMFLKTLFVNGCAYVCVDFCVCYVDIHAHVSVCVYISMRTSIVIRFWNTDLLGARFLKPLFVNGCVHVRVNVCVRLFTLRMHFF